MLKLISCSTFNVYIWNILCISLLQILEIIKQCSGVENLNKIDSSCGKRLSHHASRFRISILSQFYCLAYFHALYVLFVMFPALCYVFNVIYPSLLLNQLFIVMLCLLCQLSIAIVHLVCHISSIMLYFKCHMSIRTLYLFMWIVDRHVESFMSRVHGETLYATAVYATVTRCLKNTQESALEGGIC